MYDIILEWFDIILKKKTKTNPIHLQSNNNKYSRHAAAIIGVQAI